MARVALVTGGSRGIGEAISKGLKAAGYNVAASYAGNDEAAAKFTGETGIKTYKWDVSNYESCVAGIAKVEAELGPVDVLVNNAGITRDGMFHKMTKEQWDAALDLIYDRRDKGFDPLTRFISLFREAETGTHLISAPAATIEETLQRHIIDGEKRDLTAHLDEALTRYTPLQIINDILLAGMKVGFGLGLKVSVVAEIFGVTSGIGYVMNYSRETLATQMVFVWALVMVAVMLLADRLVFESMTRRLTRWR